MELAITLTIVIAAAVFVGWSWYRSAKKTLRPDRPATCGGCTGCDLQSELRDLSSGQTPPCNETQKQNATVSGGR